MWSGKLPIFTNGDKNSTRNNNKRSEREINNGHTKLKQSTFLYTKETPYRPHTKQHS